MLRKHICERFPADGTFDRYIEVFGGAGWVLFYKDRHAPLEVYNDADGQLVNLMRCINTTLRNFSVSLTVTATRVSFSRTLLLSSICAG